jgi:hypothetical protein
MCVGCDENMARNLIAAAAPMQPPVKGFQKAIDEVRAKGRPMTLDFADALMEGLGGSDKLAQRIADDIKALRGENLPPEVLAAHTPDFKSIKGLYELIVRVIRDRDSLLTDTDPFEGVSEEDISAIASQACFARIPSDAAFRQELLVHLVNADPHAVMMAAGVAMMRIPLVGSVEVIDEP